jgi:hypothetical protein
LRYGMAFQMRTGKSQAWWYTPIIPVLGITERLESSWATERAGGHPELYGETLPQKKNS